MLGCEVVGVGPPYGCGGCLDGAGSNASYDKPLRWRERVGVSYGGLVFLSRRKNRFV